MIIEGLTPRTLSVRYAGLTAVALSIVAAGAYWLVEPHVRLVILIIVGFGTVSAIIANFHAWQVRFIRQVTRDIEQLTAHSCIAYLFAGAPLPFSPYAISPDVGALLIREILFARPNSILEFGSGTSTVIMAKCLASLGHGRVFSIEEDARWADHTRSLLRLHRLEHCAAVVHSRLTRSVRGVWYSGECLAALPKDIGLVFIDGPNASHDPIIRAPALEHIWDKLTENATIILDDGARQGEKTIVKGWVERYGNCLDAKYVDTGRGTWVIKRISTTHEDQQA